jgi:hypothetical protein
MLGLLPGMLDLVLKFRMSLLKVNDHNNILGANRPRHDWLALPLVLPHETAVGSDLASLVVNLRPSAGSSRHDRSFHMPV